ncbi:MAG: IMS domain-containing protein [Elainellaceae cyanobacterium]
MRIPLDYYRILGLPIQATPEQLQQAHRDRTLQLPRREYSDAAIAARRQLIDEAYDVLSNPDQRQDYDSRFLARSYDLESSRFETPRTAGTPQNGQLLTSDDSLDPYTPSIEIDDHQLVGALLILLELGEYELVLKLGRPYLSSGSVGLDNGRFGDPDIVAADIVLTVALSCLELGREQWQQGQYENAAESLETGQELLLREGLFPSVRGEMQADLFKLRPYRILELLALPEDHHAARRQGLSLLQDMLQERGGIDGVGDDQSGLNTDDFLRFIQQLRGYLTAAEQQTLFESEARRPSAVATYLAVYSLLARGFAQRQPSLIRRAKLMLVRLVSRQDVYLEQAICALLLGQTEEASHALERSQEYPSLAFIREHSKDSPDLLPGLCLYSERWLQNEVFPHFRDLAQQQASLKDYFADEHVQAYLEELPNEPEATNQWSMAASSRVSYGASQSLGASRYQSAYDDASAYGSKPASRGRGGIFGDESAGATATAEPNHGSEGLGDRGVSTMPAAERISQLSPEGRLNGSDSESRYARSDRGRSPHGDTDPQARRANRLPGGTDSTTRRRGSSIRRAPRLDRLVFLLAMGFVGLIVLWFLVSRIYGWLSQSFAGSPLEGEQLQITLNEPVVPIPEPPAPDEQAANALEGPLTLDRAENVIQAWFEAKSDALGSDYEVEALDNILVDPALTQQINRVEEVQQDGEHWEYEHPTLEVTSVELFEDDPDQAIVEVSVTEVGELYRDDQVDLTQSYDSNLVVQYRLVRDDEQWKIQDFSVGE